MPELRFEIKAVGWPGITYAEKDRAEKGIKFYCKTFKVLPEQVALRQLQVTDTDEPSFVSVKEDFESRLFNEAEGIICPCCGRFDKIYNLNFSSGLARTLLWLHRYTLEHELENGWVHVPSYGPRWLLKLNNIGKLAYWKLIENRPNRTDPTKKDSGVYRIIEKGVHVATGQRKIERSVSTYHEEVMAVDPIMISIEKALGKRFDYQELMTTPGIMNGAIFPARG